MSAIEATKGLVKRSRVLDSSARRVWAAAHLARRGRALRAYRARAGLDTRVMIGSGPTRRPGWLRTDVMPRDGAVYLDATKRWPFPDASVWRIHCEHMIEHVDYAAGRRMLAECRRVLLSGGRLRVATPDARVVTSLLHRELDEAERAMVRAANARHDVPAAALDDPLWVVNRQFNHHGHQLLYTRELLTRCLEASGFTAISWHHVGESDDPEFVDIESHGDSIGNEYNRWQTMVCEASPAPPVGGQTG